MIKAKTLSLSAVQTFHKKIYQHFSKHARILPWRNTDNPYHILVSEIMLQQTQVERVVKKYEQFIKLFPDFHRLAHAPLRKILTVWQGLGYNRRAIALQQIARRIVEESLENLPSTPEVLETFPGIGKATAAAIAAFAFHQPTVLIETNIRRVFIHCFFADRKNVKDAEILPLIKTTLDTANPRQWYYALMDYGVMLKKEHQNPNRRSAHYQRQSAFEGSNRQVRGMILKLLTEKRGISKHEIACKIRKDMKEVEPILAQLKREGFLKEQRKKFSIA